jgi:hypothetical protein
MVDWKRGFVHVNNPTIARQLGMSGRFYFAEGYLQGGAPGAVVVWGPLVDRYFAQGRIDPR